MVFQNCSPAPLSSGIKSSESTQNTPGETPAATNQAPIANAGADSSITLPSTASLSGSVSDDGLPNGSVLTAAWSKVSGIGTVTFANASAAITTATFSAAGTYVLRLTASDGVLSSSDTVTVIVASASTPAPPNQAPTVDAGPDRSITLPATASLNGSASDDGLPAGSTLTRTWIKDSGAGTVTFANASAAATTATFSQAGTYVLRLTASDGTLSSSDTMSVVVAAAPPPGSGNILNVPSQYSTIQAAVNAASRGDTIIVQAGRTYTETVNLPYKGPGTEYITIQSSALSSLPAAGNRVQPSDSVNMPTIRSPYAGSEAAIRAEPASNPPSYYKFVGIQILRHNSTQFQQSPIYLGDFGTGQDTYGEVPHHFIFDRCIVRGADNASTARGFYFNVRDSQIINSYIDNFWQDGGDSQGILMTNGAERNLVANNFIEAGSENIMLGGADPDIPNFVPNNITIQNNHFFKRLSWRNANPRRVVKNLFEIKNGKNIILENNIFENNWYEAQAGHSILFTCRSDGQAPWTVCQDITFRYNIVKNVRSGFNITRTDDWTRIQLTNNINVNNNLWIIAGTAMGDDGWLGMFAGAGNNTTLGPMSNIKFDHNTFITTSNSGSWLWGANDSGDPLFNNFVWTNNIVASAAGGTWSGLRNDAGATGTAALNNIAPSQWTMTGNVFQINSSGYPASNNYVSNIASIGFINPSQSNFELSPSSPYKGAAPGGKDIGADMTELNKRTACVVSGQRSLCP